MGLILIKNKSKVPYSKRFVPFIYIIQLGKLILPSLKIKYFTLFFLLDIVKYSWKNDDSNTLFKGYYYLSV